MASNAPKLHEVTWFLPVHLYKSLIVLQETLKRPGDLTPRWETVEALATHFLTVAVREAGLEIARKAESERLVQLPGRIIQP